MDSLPTGPKAYGRQCLPSGQLDESVQNDVWTSIIVTEIHAIRRELVLRQDRAHLATIARALMITPQDGPNGQTCAEGTALVHHADREEDAPTSGVSVDPKVRTV